MTLILKLARLSLFSVRRIFIFLFLLKGTLAFTQNQGELMLGGTYHNQSLESFFDTLETRYPLRFFYRKEWIDSCTVDKTFRNTPLVQALNNILVDTDLTFMFFQDDGVVIYPQMKDRVTRNDELSQMLIIGNPLNLGRYRSAVLSGRVVDGETGEPLPGAILYETKGRKGTSTGADGSFSIELPTGDHQIQF